MHVAAPSTDPMTSRSTPRANVNDPSRYSSLLNAASVAQLVLARYFSAASPVGFELTPWAQSDAGGLTLLRRF